MTIPNLSSKQASVYALFVFTLTVALAILLPFNTITLSGLLVVIFLSVFVHTKSSTIIAGAVSAAVISSFLLWHSRRGADAIIWTDCLFLLVLVLFSTLIVLYIKRLFRNIEFDKSHMTSLFENATEGIIVTNSRAEIMLANPAACRMFAYEAEEMIGNPIEMLLPQKFRAGHTKLRDGFYEDPHNRVMGSGRDLYGAKKDGANFPVEVSLSSYQQNSNRYAIAFIVDITHRKEIEKSMQAQQAQLEKVSDDIRQLNTELEAKVEDRTQILKEALQRLEISQAELSEALDKERQLNEIKSRFVAMASHEFRTPLSAVLSSASLLGKYTTTEQQENREKHISRIKDSVKHLNDLLEDFLSLGKLDEGKVGATLAPLNLPATVHDTIDELRGLVKEDQQIIYEHHGEEVIVSDRNLLKNILINLVSNGVKFSEAGSRILINTAVTKESITLSVKDEGMGISEEDQQHLFSSFFRGANAANIQGTGLGLHIVKRYADLLGGKLKLRSRLGGGTTILLEIPNNKEAHEQNDTGH